MAEATQTTVDPGEIERFSRIAAEWWDPTGKFAPLHRLNPIRVGYIRDRAAAARRSPAARSRDCRCSISAAAAAC